MPIPTNTCKSIYWTSGSWIWPDLTPCCNLNRMLPNTWNTRSCCCCCWMWGTSIWEHQMFNRWLIASAARILTSGSGSFSSSTIATTENIKNKKLVHRRKTTQTDAPYKSEMSLPIKSQKKVAWLSLFKFTVVCFTDCSYTGCGQKLDGFKPFSAMDF